MEIAAAIWLVSQSGTRSVDWLGTARSLPHTHIPERSEAADACDLSSGMRLFSRRFQWRGRHNSFCKLPLNDKWISGNASVWSWDIRSHPRKSFEESRPKFSHDCSQPALSTIQHNSNVHACNCRMSAWVGDTVKSPLEMCDKICTDSVCYLRRKLMMTLNKPISAIDFNLEYLIGWWMVTSSCVPFHIHLPVLISTAEL